MPDPKPETQFVDSYFFWLKVCWTSFVKQTPLLLHQINVTIIVVLTTYSRRYPVGSSGQRAPTGWRSQCRTPLWRAEGASPNQSPRNIEPGQKINTKIKIGGRLKRNSTVNASQQLVSGMVIDDVSQLQRSHSYIVMSVNNLLLFKLHSKRGNNYKTFSMWPA